MSSLLLSQPTDLPDSSFWCNKSLPGYWSGIRQLLEDPEKCELFPPLRTIPGAWRAAGLPGAERCLPPDVTVAPKRLGEAV